MLTSPNESRATGHDSCKTNPIYPPSIHTPIYSSTLPLIYSGIYPPRSQTRYGGADPFMQNEPNLKLPAIKNMKNKPNLNISATKIPLFLASWLLCLLQFFTRQMQNFTKKSKKIPAFCKFLTLTHLTPYTTKTYTTILPQNTLKERNLPTVFLAGKYAKQTQFHSTKCRSEAEIRLWRTKQTQFIFNQRETRDKRRIMQNEPNFYQIQILRNEPNSETYAEPKAKSRRAGKPNLRINSLKSLCGKDLRSYANPEKQKNHDDMVKVC